MMRAMMLSLLVVAPLATPIHGDEPRAHPNPTIPAAAGEDTATFLLEINGLRVIIRRNLANDVVAANLYLLGGTQQLTPATQGIEALLLASSERGTRDYPREKVRQRTAQLGSTIVIGPSDDWTLFGFTALRSTFDSTWAVFADRLMAPTLDSAQVELVRERMLTAASLERTQPDPLVNQLAESLSFFGHTYGLAPGGTESSLRSITVGSLRSYQAKEMVTSRMLLVVVGNVERSTVERLVSRTLATLPRGNYAWTPPPMPAKHGRGLVVKRAPLPTNYLLGFYAGPRARDPDYQALRLASAVLSGRLFTEIRSRRHLSYEVDAPFVERAIGTGGLYVTTVDPNTTLQLMRTEVNRLQTELIDPNGLERLVQQFITDYFLKNETDGDQATFLARAAIYQGDYRRAGLFVDELRRVSPEDVRRVARTYMRDFRFAYLGNPDRLSRALLEQF
jgi:zinc protease